MGKVKVFVSFAHNDYEFVEPLIKALREDYDIESIETLTIAVNIIESLTNMIKSADFIIVIYSENYANSRNANDELAFAIAHNKRILPVVVGDVLIPFYLMHIQCLPIKDFTEIVPNVLEALLTFNHDTGENPKEPDKIAENLDEVISALNKALVDHQLTLVCGAGVSFPSGIPSWNELLTSMIDNVLFGGKHHENPYDTTAEELISKMPQSSIVLGKYLKLISGNNFHSNIEHALYEHIEFFDDGSESYADTRLMDAIAELARPKRSGKQLESIITFNFDDVIETKLRKSFISYCSIWKEGQRHSVDALPIYHVHGFLPYGESVEDPNLVFSEEAYHSQFIDPYSWSNLLQLNVFSNNVCLFIGLSLSDPNLRRILDISYRRNLRRQHYIVMRRATPENASDEDEEKTRLVVEKANTLFEQDANSLGLNVMWCSDYDEIPSILKRIAE